MSTHKDEKNGTWYVMVRYHDWKGTKRQKCKRGFATRREAQEWERNFRLQTEGDPDMTFEAFLKLYENDMRPRLKENTWLSKEHMIRKKLFPTFGKKMLSEIETRDIIAWQNELLAYRDEKNLSWAGTPASRHELSRRCQSGTKPSICAHREIPAAAWKECEYPPYRYMPLSRPGRGQSSWP